MEIYRHVDLARPNAAKYNSMPDQSEARMFCEHSGVVLPTVASFVKCVAHSIRVRLVRGAAVSAKLQMKVFFGCLIVLGLSLRTNAQTSFAITHVAVIDVIR